MLNRNFLLLKKAYSHGCDVFHHGIADAIGERDHLGGVDWRLVEPFVHHLLGALGVRRRHVDDRFEMFHLVAQVQNVPAGFDVDLHGGFHFLIEPDGGRQMEDDVHTFDQNFPIGRADAEVGQHAVARDGSDFMVVLWAG